MLQCYKWLYDMKKKDEKRMEVEHQKVGYPYDWESRRRNSSFPQNHRTNREERRSADSEVGDDAKPLARCEEKKKIGQSIGNVIRRCKA